VSTPWRLCGANRSLRKSTFPGGITALFRRIANLFRRSRLDRDIDAELQAHIALATEAKMRQGLPHAVARREAILRFGNPTSTRERVIAADASLSIENLARDLRYALRQLRHSPGFALTAPAPPPPLSL
jgi:hypothetical protein